MLKKFTRLYLLIAIDKLPISRFCFCLLKMTDRTLPDLDLWICSYFLLIPIFVARNRVFVNFDPLSMTNKSASRYVLWFMLRV